jgi:hypothetical protein
MDDEFSYTAKTRDGNVIEDALFDQGACGVCLNHQVWAEFEAPAGTDAQDIPNWIEEKRQTINEILETYAKRTED